MENQAKSEKYAIFGEDYEMLQKLGEGSSSKVYLCRSIKDPS